MPINDDTIFVKHTIIVNKIKINDEKEIIQLHLNNKNTPAVTIVAACNNAETGVGPSIASGNQT